MLTTNVSRSGFRTRRCFNLSDVIQHLYQSLHVNLPAANDETLRRVTSVSVTVIIKEMARVKAQNSRGLTFYLRSLRLQRDLENTATVTTCDWLKVGASAQSANYVRGLL